MNDDTKLEAHRRLQVALRHQTRTYRSIYSEPEPHNRRARPIDGVLAANVKELLEQGVSPSRIRYRLHIGYATIRDALEFLGMGGAKCQR